MSENRGKAGLEREGRIGHIYRPRRRRIGHIYLPRRAERVGREGEAQDKEQA